MVSVNLLRKATATDSVQQDNTLGAKIDTGPSQQGSTSSDVLPSSPTTAAPTFIDPVQLAVEVSKHIAVMPAPQTDLSVLVTMMSQFQSSQAGICKNPCEETLKDLKPSFRNITNIMTGQLSKVDMPRQEKLKQQFHELFLTAKYIKSFEFLSVEYKQLQDGYDNYASSLTSMEKKQKQHMSDVGFSINNIIEHAENAKQVYYEFLDTQYKSATTKFYLPVVDTKAVFQQFALFISSDSSLPQKLQDFCDNCKYDPLSSSSDDVLVYEGACSFYYLGTSYF